MKPEQHTPGPWKVDIRNGCVAVYPTNTPERQSHCLTGAELWAVHYKHSIWTGNSWQLEPQVVANAKLIAAAPTMLEALEEALEISHNPKVESILMTAIAKATD